MKLLWQYGRDTHSAFTKFYELAENIRCTTLRWTGKECSRTNYGVFPFPNTTYSDFTTLTEPSTKGIRDQAHIMALMASELGEYVDIARKTFTVISIVVLVVEAIVYLRSYYTDSSFDNCYVGRTTRNQWKKKKYYIHASGEFDKLSSALWDEEKGLRHWEIKEGLKTLNLPKCSRALLYDILRKSFSTFVFIGLVVIVFLVDHFLVAALQYIKESQKFHFTLEGFTQNITDIINANMRDYNTKSCLATPSLTSVTSVYHISFLLLLAVCSCILQVMLTGIRAKLCSFFYPDRVEERADFLYFKIVTGRLNRKAELMLLVRREIEKREKQERFCPLKKFENLITSVLSNSVFCPGCSRRVNASKAKKLSLSMFDIEKCASICVDCYLDLSRKHKSYEILVSPH